MSMDRRLSIFVERRVPRERLDVSAVDDVDSKRFARTQQHFKEECDINGIMKKFERTGMLEHVNEFHGNYGDFTELPVSYHDAIDQVLAAQDMFMTVPAKVRALFDNDPGQFLAFVDDPANADRLVELGLAHRRVEPEAERAPSSEPGAGQSPAETSTAAPAAP